MKYVVKLQPVPKRGEQVTKLDALLAKRDALQAALEENTAYIAGLSKTECELRCEGCGTLLITERHFADHFVIGHLDLLNDHLNLGECPNRKA